MMRWIRLQKIRLKHVVVCIVLILLLTSVYHIRSEALGRVNEDSNKGEVGSSPSRHHDMVNQSINHDVLLIGYVMGGAVFPAEVLGMRTGAFYVHEPLHSMARLQYFKHGHVCSMVDTRCNATRVTADEAVGVVRAIFRCDTPRYKGQLRAWQLQKITGDQASWQQSLKTHCGEGENKDCRGKILGQCWLSVSRVIYTPRLSLRLAAQLLTELPNLKIIHILRDPRAVIYTKINSKRILKDDVINDASSICTKMKEDVEAARYVNSILPRRLLTIYHENLAMSPLKTMKEIYDFMNYKFDSNELILKKSQHVFSDKSTLAGGTWRSQLSWSVVQHVNQACGGIYELLGYPRIVDKHQLNNQTIPLLIKQTGTLTERPTTRSHVIV